MAEENKKCSARLIWANLLHLSCNIWYDREVPELNPFYRDYIYRPHLCMDKRLRDDILLEMAGIGMNMAVIVIGDGLKDSSHPEIAVKGAWTGGVGRVRGVF